MHEKVFPTTRPSFSSSEDQFNVKTEVRAAGPLADVELLVEIPTFGEVSTIKVVRDVILRYHGLSYSYPIGSYDWC